MFCKIQLVFRHYQVICSFESFLRWTLIPQGIFHLHKIVSVLQIISVCSSCLKRFRHRYLCREIEIYKGCDKCASVHQVF